VFGAYQIRVLPISLFIIAFTGAYANVHWMGMMVGGALFGFAMVSVYISANSVCDLTLLDSEPTRLVHCRQLFKCRRFSHRRQDAYAILDWRKRTIMDHSIIRKYFPDVLSLANYSAQSRIPVCWAFPSFDIVFDWTYTIYLLL
jgi:uncharacterized CHY-type Zn-finger protein